MNDTNARTMHRGLSHHVALTLLLAVSLAGCGSEDSASTPASPSAQADTSPTPDACALLTPEEVGQITGWKQPAASPVQSMASYLSSCHFLDGGSAMHFIAITVSVGGAIHANSAEYAQSVAETSGSSVTRASPVEGFPVPVIDMDIGGTHGMQARTPDAIELTVMSDSAEWARALFPKALARLPGGTGKD